MKERISLTLDRNLIKQIDEQVDGSRIKNRSHAVELFLKKSLGNNVPNKALILAGGEGTRMRPLTYEIPKAMVPLKGKTLIEHHFDLFKKFEIKDIFLSVGHMKEKIKNHFGNGAKFGVNITYVEEKTPMGTAGPLKLASKYLKGSFVVVNGDNLFDIDLGDMYRFHKANKALITIALTTVREIGGYGVVGLVGNKIVSFNEKPKKAETNLINAGLYIMEPPVIDLIPKGKCSLEKEIFPKVAKQGKLFGYHFAGQWADTGTMERYEKALKEWRGI